MSLVKFIQLGIFFYNAYGEFTAWLSTWLAARLAACIAAPLRNGGQKKADQQLKRVSPKTRIF